MLKEFTAWLSKTSLSIVMQNHNSWVIPAIQSIHIIAIGIVLTSVLMIDLRVLGWNGREQTLRQTTNRFFPWLSGALGVLLVTGLLMVIAEPVRELLSLSFWLKMSLIVVGTVIATIFQIALRKNEPQWENSIVERRSVRFFAVLTLLVWVGIVILGRLIAYDYVWGSWSLKPRA